MSNITLPVILLLVIDALFVLVGWGLILLLARVKRVAFAVLKRNFIGYFSNPTGYLFILLFVGACSVCAFFPHNFFNDNLATLHELNRWFPWIMLVYIATITMGIWSEERRQGTDELLLTVPADDWDIVLGKYLAAVAIYTVSLLFSQVTNFLVIAFLSLGDVDLGLFATTYLGYWVVGLAMIAVAMVGSFLTRNQTVGFIFGVLLNLPLVLSSYADAVLGNQFALRVAQFSYAEQFFDFGRGVISLRALVFFGMLVAIGLYLSVVLVGRRHWVGSKDGHSMLGHYAVRTVALVLIALGLTYFFVNHDRFRLDGTSQQISKLAPDTNRLIQDLETKNPIVVEAFISRQIPEDYIKTKVDLISKLSELKARGGNRVDVKIYDNLEPSSEEAARAEEQYGIRPARVLVRERGTMQEKDLYMGAAFTCGLEKVIVPFFDQGIPVEYELVRSITTVAQAKRKRLGVVSTDAQLFGGFDMQRMSQTPKQLIVEELEKQYEVVQIDPSSPIQEEVDVLLAVQPSSLNPQQLDNFIEAVRKGTPTAIFEDPLPVMMNAPGTSQPKTPRGGMMGMGAPPEPKGEIQRLWDLLGVRLVGKEVMGQSAADVVWQDFNPYKKARGFRQITKEWVFVSPDAPGAQDPLSSKDATTEGLSQLLLLFPGAIEPRERPGVTFTPLVTTGADVGTIGYQELTMGGQDPFALEFKRQPASSPLVLAARITSQPAGDTATKTDTPAAGAPPAEGEKPAATEAPADKPAAASQDQLNVVLVTDIDLMHSEFLRVRAQPNMSDINWQFDNVTFVLNVIDSLAQDERFLDIRKRQSRYSTLKLVEARTAAARDEAETEITKFNEDFRRAEEEAKKRQGDALAELQKQVDDLKKKSQEGGAELTNREVQRALQAAVQQVALKERVEQRRMDTTVERLTRERDRKLIRIERELDTEVQRVQNIYKAMALFLPMLPPLAIGLAVFMRRRALESESITPVRRK